MVTLNPRSIAWRYRSRECIGNGHTLAKRGPLALLSAEIPDTTAKVLTEARRPLKRLRHKTAQISPLRSVPYCIMNVARACPTATPMQKSRNVIFHLVLNIEPQPLIAGGDSVDAPSRPQENMAAYHPAKHLTQTAVLWFRQPLGTQISCNLSLCRVGHPLQ